MARATRRSLVLVSCFHSVVVYMVLADAHNAHNMVGLVDGVVSSGSGVVVPTADCSSG